MPGWKKACSGCLHGASMKATGPALQGQDRVNGAQFSRDESRILTWSNDSTARICLLNADLDVPAEHVELGLPAARSDSRSSNGECGSNLYRTQAPVPQRKAIALLAAFVTVSNGHRNALICAANNGAG